jgi:hypothetical protein
MKTYGQLWEYLAEFFSVWEIFQIKFLEVIKTYSVQYMYMYSTCSVTFTESLSLFEIMWKVMVEWNRPKMEIYQYNETNVLQFLFNLLRIKGLFMFRALLTHP